MGPLALGVIALVFLGLTALTFSITQSALAPAPLWNTAWFLLFLTAAAFGGDYYYDVNAVLLLATLAASFNFGCVAAAATTQRAEPRRQSRSLQVPTWPLWACVAVAAVGVSAASSAFGTSIFAFRSVSDLFAASQTNAVLLFRGEVALPFLAKLGFSAMQVGLALAGARRVLSAKGSAAPAALLFLSALLYGLITTQRTYILVPIVWFVAGYVAAAVWSGQRRLPPRVLLRAFLVLTVLVLLVVALRAVRTGGAASVSGDSFSSSRVWLAGYVPAFSSFWANSAQVVGSVPGFFGGVTGLLGQKGESLTGGNQEIGNGALSNAPTMMRDAVLVGGPFLAAVLVIVVGFVAHHAYRRTVAGGNVAAASYAGIIAAVLWSPNAWFYSYGGRMLAWLLLIIGAAVVTVTPRSKKSVPAIAEQGRQP